MPTDITENSTNLFQYIYLYFISYLKYYTTAAKQL